MSEMQPIPTEPAKVPTPAPLTFLQKMQLFKKKYDYVNGKGLEPVAAEEAARKDLHLPEMTDDERARAVQPSLWQKILNNKIMVALGITAFLTGKKAQLQADLKAKVDEKLSAKTDEKQPENPVATQAAPEVAPAKAATAQDAPTK
ncbi:MAG: hypothetical protein V2A63_00150 [Patescibacteria group bacterium]